MDLSGQKHNISCETVCGTLSRFFKQYNVKIPVFELLKSKIQTTDPRLRLASLLLTNYYWSSVCTSHKDDQFKTTTSNHCKLTYWRSIISIICLLCCLNACVLQGGCGWKNDNQDSGRLAIGEWSNIRRKKDLV